MKKIFVFASLKSIKKGVGSRVGSGSGSISQRYGSGNPDPRQNVTDPQHCSAGIFKKSMGAIWAPGSQMEIPQLSKSGLKTGAGLSECMNV